MRPHPSPALIEPEPPANAVAARRLPHYLAMAGGVFAAAVVGIALTRESGRVASIWLANAMVVTVLLRSKTRYWPALLLSGFAANVAANLVMGDPVPRALALGVCNSVEIVLAGWFTRPGKDGRPLDLSSIRPLLRFLVLGGLLAPAVSGLLASLVLRGDVHSWLWPHFHAWFSADALGLLTIVPLFHQATREDLRALFRRPAFSELLGLLLLVPALTVALVGLHELAWLFLASPLILLAALRLGPPGAAAASLLVTIAGVGALVHWAPYSERYLQLQGEIQSLQLFVLVNALIALPVATLVRNLRATARELRAEHENFLKVMAAAPVGLLVVDRETVITRANPAISHLVVREPSQLIGQRAGGGLGCVHSAEAPGGCGYASACSDCGLRRAIESVLSQGESVVQQEIPLAVRIGGETLERWLSVSVEPVEIDGRRHAIVAVDDVTDRKGSEDALRRSETKYRVLTETMKDVIWVLDAETLRFLYVSPSVERLRGFTPAEILSAPMDAALTPESAAQVRQSIASQIRSFESGRESWDAFFTNEVEQPRKDGTTVWTEVTTTYRKVPGPDGRERIEIHGVTRDISARRRAESALQESRAFIVEAEKVARIGSYRWDLVTRKVSWSEGMFDLFGVDRETFDGDIERVVAARIHPDDAAAVREANVRVRGEGRTTPLSYRIVLPDGAERTVWAQGELVRDDSGSPLALIGFVQDITERKRAEDALRSAAEEARARAEELTALMDAVPAITFIAHDPECLRMTSSREAERLLRVGAQANTSMSAPPDERPVTFRPVRDGREVPAKDLPVQVAATGVPVKGAELTLEFSDGTARTILGDAVPLYDARGAVRGAVGAFLDITDRKQAEEAIRQLALDLERRVEERTAQLAEASREMEAFSYSVSHDLRAPLRAIDGFSARLQKGYEASLDDEGRRLVQVVRNNAHRMATLIDELLALSRVGREELLLEEIDMRNLAVHVAAEVLREGGSQDMLRVGDLPAAWASRRLLTQVLENLLSNAVKFSSKADHPAVEIWGEAGGGSVTYHVRDNGAGFDMAYLGKLFGVFQRLHTPAEFPGVGVGLALVKRIVTRHGGAVWAEGEVGKGATFSFSLPGRNPQG